MTFDYWCVFFAFILPYVLVILAKAGAYYDNHAPRPFMETVQGWRKRAYWSHLNSFEAFGPFAAAVIIAHQLQVPALTLNILAVIFVFARIFYAVFYISDKAPFRSLMWFVGFFATVSLFVAAARV